MWRGEEDWLRDPGREEDNDDGKPPVGVVEPKLWTPACSTAVGGVDPTPPGLSVECSSSSEREMEALEEEIPIEAELEPPPFETSWW
jgi:hypothetical protein